MFTVDIIYEIIKYLDYQEIIQFSTITKKIYQNERLWEYLYKLKFNNIPHIDINLNWRDSYKLTYYTLYNTSNNLVTNVNIVISKYLKKDLLVNDVMKFIVEYMSKQTSYDIDYDDYYQFTLIIGDKSLGISNFEMLDYEYLEQRTIFNNTTMRTNASEYIPTEVRNLLEKFGYDID